MDPNERKILASIAANTRWSREPNRQEATATARKAAEDRFSREVDPEGQLDPKTRAKMAANARAAFFLRLSREGVAARRRNKTGAR